MQTTGAIDLEFSRKKYIWTNGHHGHSFIRERLDRAIASPSLIVMFQKVKVDHVVALESDHMPLLIKTDDDRNFKNRLFQFIKA